MQHSFFGIDAAYLLLVLGALFVHACYQLSVSVLTYMSSHRLSKRASVRQLLSTGTGYAIGVIGTTSLLLVALASMLSYLRTPSPGETPQLVGIIVSGVVPVVGLLTMTAYYRRGAGTQLWLPRQITAYLLGRAKKTESFVEASMLGAATVIGESPFLAGPLLIAGATLMQGPPASWTWFAILYSMFAALPLVIVTLYLTSGHSVARVQRWREDNKQFLQWTSSIALILLTIYFAVLQFGVNR